MADVIVQVQSSKPIVQVRPNTAVVQVSHNSQSVIQTGVQGPPGRDAASVGNQESETDSAVIPGQPLYLKSNGHVDLASAAAIGTARVAGLCVMAASAGTSAEYSPDGTVELADWTAITDTATLTPGQTYFLSVTAGKLTTTAPTESGQVVIVVGTALTTTKLAIEIQTPILL